MRIYIYNMNQVDFLKCLADQTRLDMVMLILQKGELCVCDISAALDLSQPKISRHLAQLRSCKILQDRRQGQWIYYDLHADLADWCLDVLNGLQERHHRFEQLHLKMEVNSSHCG